MSAPKIAQRLLFFVAWSLAVACPYSIDQTALAQQPAAPSRPNILWITSEDNGPQLGCYGDDYADSPNIDALAAQGMRYLNCWSNAPVCAPARTTIVSGCYPPSLGAHHMRSEVPLPAEFKLYPELFRQAGYYCSNNSKQDYNLQVPKDLWDESSNSAHWRKRKPGQPFFAVFNFTISHESKLRDRPHTLVHDPAQVSIPPYHPDTPEVRHDWAQYYDRITEMDRQVGRVLDQLEQDGLVDNTIVFYYGDHGSGMPRSKRWLYQSGLSVPLIVRVPERLRELAGATYKAGTSHDALVSFVDLFPTVLSLAGLEIPQHVQGQAFLGSAATSNREYLYAYRDRMDERYDMSRAVRDQQFLYIRNYLPHRPQGAYLNYMFQTPTTQVWKELFDAGQLTPEQQVFWKPKAPEELYDLSADPYQINNLAGSAEHGAALERMRAALQSWMLEIRDLGLMPEGYMLAQSQASSPNELGHDEQRYPLEKILAAADLASRRTEGDLPQLLANVVSPEAIVRYWTATGLLIRAELGEETGRKELVKAARGMSTDSFPYTRCVANEVLARFGNEADRRVALKALLAEANNSQRNLFVSIAALNALQDCRPSNVEIGTALEGLPQRDALTSSRYDGYVERLAQRLTEIAE